MGVETQLPTYSSHPRPSSTLAVHGSSVAVPSAAQLDQRRPTTPRPDANLDGRPITVIDITSSPTTIYLLSSPTAVAGDSSSCASSVLDFTVSPANNAHVESSMAVEPPTPHAHPRESHSS